MRTTQSDLRTTRGRMRTTRPWKLKPGRLGPGCGRLKPICGRLEAECGRLILGNKNLDDSGPDADDSSRFADDSGPDADDSSRFADDSGPDADDSPLEIKTWTTRPHTQPPSTFASSSFGRQGLGVISRSALRGRPRAADRLMPVAPDQPPFALILTYSSDTAPPPHKARR